MKNQSSSVERTHLTSNAFLDNVMPQIKINKQRFSLDGIDPKVNHSHQSQLDHVVNQ